MKKKISKILTAAFITTLLPNVYLVDNAYADTEDNYSKYNEGNLVWEDNFDGDSLNLADWNYETHEPGWVNNELQEYTDDIKNIYVKDGNLVLKGIKEETPEGVKYTSGKVTTQNKHDFKYGRFEARLKVPEGQGLWPAFWMMPTEENLYGPWPRCGEIDIMEVLGHEANKAYGTIHYGNPHREDQGYYILDQGTFADDYHVFAVEWEPSEMRFYIDGNLYHTVNDWFTKQDGGDELTYPAPFDQTFYLQFNLAIGGNWPGNPDETTDFENAEYLIDYVKVYQLDSYDENVSKPEKPDVELREPDATGNYVNNGNFAVEEDLADGIDWSFLTALGGQGSASIRDNKIIINSQSQGTEDYSLQLLQAGLPLKKNGIYKLSFDAKASEARNMLVGITSPDRGYIRQFQDTLVDLTTDFQTYSYEFTMKDYDDANGRLEFNCGNRQSLADIEITNVRLEKIGQAEETTEEVKTILPDGNYVYNGTFDVGADRLKYWDIDTNIEGVDAYVTNTNNIREFRVNVPATATSLSDVILRESELGISPNKEYYLSFDAYGEEAKTIKAQINAESFSADITTEKQSFKYKFTTDDILKNTNLEFLLGAPGVTYIDNVRIADTSLIINGDFDNGFSKWEVFADSSVSSAVSSAIDTSTGNNAAQINIKDTGDADWKIQLKQTGVKLEKGKKYILSLDAKSTIDRPIMFTIQRDGSNDNDWRPYVPTKTENITSDYTHFDVPFEMTEDTDLNSIFTISMGAVNNQQITNEHSVFVDNVKLVEVTDTDGSGDITPGGDDDNPGDDQPGNDNPGDDQPADDDKPADDQPAGDKPADDQPAGDKPADDQPADGNNNTVKPSPDNSNNGNNGGNSTVTKPSTNNQNTHNSVDTNKDKQNGISTLVQTGIEHHYGLIGLLLVLSGLGLALIKRREKKAY